MARLFKRSHIQMDSIRFNYPFSNTWRKPQRGSTKQAEANFNQEETEMEVNVSWYQVRDINAAKKFYGDVLGLKKTFDMGGWCEFSHTDGAASIGLNAMREDDDERGATVVLRVDD